MINSFEHLIVEAQDAATKLLSNSESSFKDKLLSVGFDLGELRGHNWRDIDFSDQDLRGLDFSGSDLRGANFTNSLIQGASFRGAKVEHEDLLRASDYMAWSSRRDLTEVVYKHLDYTYQAPSENPFSGKRDIVPLISGGTLVCDDHSMTILDSADEVVAIERSPESKILGAFELEQDMIVYLNGDGKVGWWKPSIPQTVLGLGNHDVKSVIHLPVAGGYCTLHKDHRLMFRDGNHTLIGGESFKSRFLVEGTGSHLLSVYSSHITILKRRDESYQTRAFIPLASFGNPSAEITSITPIANDRFVVLKAHSSTVFVFGPSGLENQMQMGETVYGCEPLLPDGFLTWSEGGRLRAWSQSGNRFADLHGHKRTVRGASELDDGRIISWSPDGTLKVWLRSGALLSSLPLGELVLDEHSDGSLEVRGIKDVIALKDGYYMCALDMKKPVLIHPNFQDFEVLDEASDYGDVAFTLLGDGRLASSWSGNKVRLFG